MQNCSFHKGTHLDIYKKAPFSQDQEQISEGSNTADSDKEKEGNREREEKREEEGRRRRRESVPKPLNEIKAPYKTPLISIVELISSSTSALVGA